MKKLLILLIVCISLTGCSKKACDVNAGELCFDEETNQYIIEENAKIVVAVENAEFGIALIDLWNQTHPENYNVIEYIVQNEYDGNTYLNQRADVSLMWSNEATRLHNWLMPIDDLVKEEIKPTLCLQYGADLNHDDFYYVPMFGYGWVFSYNASMMEELGIDLTDENNDGRPDLFGSFELIMENFDLNMESIYRDQVIQSIFEFNFTDASQAMTYLSLNGFIPFENFKAEEPGFESEQFLGTLEILSTLGQFQFSNLEETTFESYLSDQNQLFGLVGTWMHYDDFETMTEQDFRFIPFPSANEKTVTPYTLSAGYVISKSTKYPNAALEVIRLIRSNEGLEAFARTSSYPLLYNYNQPVKKEEDKQLELQFKTENLKEISEAMMFGKEESMVAFELDPAVRGWAMISRAKIYSVLEEVFYQRLLPVDAQNKIIEQINIEMKPYIPEIEEETEDTK